MSDEENDFVFVNASDAHRGSHNETVSCVSPQTRVKIQKWLCPTEFSAESSDYNKHLRSHVPRTGEWLRQSSAFKRWHQEGEQGLWVNGIPGSGKSVVAASLINDFLRHENVPVLFFFFRHANVANRTPKQMVRDWLSQFLEFSALLQSRLKEIVERHPSLEDVTFEDLWQCLSSAAMTAEKVYCIADALDEMESGNDWVLPKLVELGQQKPSTVKVITTSRQSPHIEAILQEPRIISIALDRKIVDQDIATYIKYTISSRPMLRLSTDESRSIEGVVQRKANGLFLYAKLMMDELLGTIETTDLHVLLEALPTGIDDMFTTLLKEHSKRSGVTVDLQVLVLQWITHASRPLRLLEVAELIRSLPAGKGLGGIQETKETVRSACGPLLTLLPDETLQVVHHSFTEFLINPSRTQLRNDATQYEVFDPQYVHKRAFMLCIEYITACSTLEKRTRDDIKKAPYFRSITCDQRDAYVLKHPFLHYAISNWMVHISKLTRLDGILIRTLDDFFAPSNDVFSYWQGLWYVTDYFTKPAVLMPIHLLSDFDMKVYIAELCRRGLQANVKDSAGRTPLSYACEKGHEEVACLLLDNGATHLESSDLGITPLHYACAADSPALVQRLLEAGADPFFETPEPKVDGRIVDKRNYPQMCSNRRRFGKSALEHACSQGYLQCLRVMLDSINPTDYHVGPLHWAARAGKTEVAELLLDVYHVDSNIKDAKGNTALCLAANSRAPSTVESLLKAGARIDEYSTGLDQYFGPVGSYVVSGKKPRLTRSYL